jgi:hypothetical protein
MKCIYFVPLPPHPPPRAEKKSTAICMYSKEHDKIRLWYINLKTYTTRTIPAHTHACMASRKFS